MKITLSQIREALKEAILDEKKKSKSKKKASAKRKSKKKSRRKKRKAKRDACYHKVKSRYDVWPSAYASGALVKCRKVGAKNWGNSKKENLDLDSLQSVIQEKVDELIEKKKKNPLGDWFDQQGPPGPEGGWVDCNTCRKDKKTGRKKCKKCGRDTGEKRAKYPKCRPTPSACSKKGNYGKKSKAGKKG
jgi:hypothetical protein